MTIKVCDLPPTDRPQYRLAQLGGNYLSNVELLALIIGTDQSIAIAQRLFAKFKTLDNIATPCSVKASGKDDFCRFVRMS